MPSNGRLGCFNRRTPCEKHSHWWMSRFICSGSLMRGGAATRWRSFRVTKPRSWRAVENREGCRKARSVPGEAHGRWNCRADVSEAVGKRLRRPERRLGGLGQAGLYGRLGLVTRPSSIYINQHPSQRNQGILNICAKSQPECPCDLSANGRADDAQPDLSFGTHPQGRISLHSGTW